MTPIKKFAYYSLQVLFTPLIIYAALRYRRVEDYDAFYEKICIVLDWFYK